MLKLCLLTVCLITSHCAWFGPKWNFPFNFMSFKIFVFLHLFAGNSGICLPDYFHNRDISEDYCLRPGHAPELLRQERLEHAGLCHRHRRVSSRGGTRTSAAHTGTHGVYWQASNSRPSIILLHSLLGSLSACPVAVMTARVQHTGTHTRTHTHAVPCWEKTTWPQ